MDEKQKIYDELCEILTSYETNTIEPRITQTDLYNILVKIQNNWEEVITS